MRNESNETNETHTNPVQESLDSVQWTHDTRVSFHVVVEENLFEGR